MGENWKIIFKNRFLVDNSYHVFLRLDVKLRFTDYCCLNHAKTSQYPSDSRNLSGLTWLKTPSILFLRPDMRFQFTACLRCCSYLFMSTGLLNLQKLFGCWKNIYFSCSSACLFAFDFEFLSPFCTSVVRFYLRCVHVFLSKTHRNRFLNLSYLERHWFLISDFIIWDTLLHEAKKGCWNEEKSKFEKKNQFLFKLQNFVGLCSWQKSIKLSSPNLEIWTSGILW